MQLERELYRKEGYVYARSPEEIARQFGYERVARLASNENPFGPSQKAIEAVSAAAAGMNRYPDTTNTLLCEALARFHGNGNGYTFVAGVGMDGVIETCIRALVEPGEKVAVAVPTFSFYGIAARAQGAEVIAIPRGPDFRVDPDQFIRMAGDAKISFLCTPNNPSGTLTPPEDIRYILGKIRGMLFLDNAYVDFSELDYRPLMKEFDNLVIGRTMSKVFGLAGCRVGYAFVPSWLKPIYERAATPFALNTLSAAAAVGALADHEYVQHMISYTREWIARFQEECPMPVLPGGANFVMIDTHPMTGDACADLLAEKGVIVRSCRSFPGLEDRYIRVCVGEPWENERFLTAMKSLC